jgi:hypothetical protein
VGFVVDEVTLGQVSPKALAFSPANYYSTNVASATSGLNPPSKTPKSNLTLPTVMTISHQYLLALADHSDRAV